MRNVTIVVPVLITGCQVSLQWKMGPLIAHAATTHAASAKADGCPVAWAVVLANRVNQELDFAGAMTSTS